MKRRSFFAKCAAFVAGCMIAVGIKPAEATVESDPVPDFCYMNDPEWKQCCCTCVHHWPVHHHCCTDPKPTIKPEGRCVCGVQKGWACVAPEHGRVYDNWPLHSVGCECWEPAKTVEEIQKMVKDALSK